MQAATFVMELLRALLLFGMLSLCSSSSSSSEPVQDIRLQRQRLPGAVQGFKLKDLLSENPKDATAAYKQCVQHGSACQIPCSSISNCVGCHPAGPAGSKKNTKAAAKVCAYCLPGFKMSADRTSCQACPIGHTSKVCIMGWGEGGSIADKALRDKPEQASLFQEESTLSKISFSQHVVDTCMHTTS
jgi:hypothetical protein